MERKLTPFEQPIFENEARKKQVAIEQLQTDNRRILLRDMERQREKEAERKKAEEENKGKNKKGKKSPKLSHENVLENISGNNGNNGSGLGLDAKRKGKTADNFESELGLNEGNGKKLTETYVKPEFPEHHMVHGMKGRFSHTNRGGRESGKGEVIRKY